MILIIDNYDSFTYNLVQYVGELNFPLVIHRNDQISISHLKALNPEKIIISPGPGKPVDAGLTIEIIKECSNTTPILGVCLGHQSIGEAFESNVIKTSDLMHGKTSKIFHNNSSLFKNVHNPFIAARYHSLIIAPELLSSNLEIIAWTDDNIIMGIRHKIYPHVLGIQFHPESLWTPEGKQILRNFLNM
uniref:anthranilate synthase component 2 n=1 Tax=Goniotrichopsis reniformis TaxID=468933 RepID=UPI001FCDD81C|nr:anthranilate synthase component 2 [Goniotrichopsis reniformis]UNJ14801.1 anthranilate synthase component 2 [Goniotrichopsis reniformis]